MEINSLVEIKSNENEFEDININEDNLIGVDIFSKLEIELKNDVLFKVLNETNLSEEIISDNMRDLLKEDTHYSTTAVSRMLLIPNSTLRGWITELDDYINPVFLGDTYKLTPKSIFKMRMIQLLRKDLKYSIGYIKSITLGTEVIHEDDNKEKSINEKVEELIKENEDMKAIIKKMAQNIDVTKNVIMEIIDKDVFNKSGQVLLSSEKIPKLIESKSDDTSIVEKIDKSIKLAKEEIDEAVSKKIEEALKEVSLKNEEKELLANTNSTKQVVISTDEIKSYSRKLKQRSIWEKIFGIKSKK